MREYDMLGHFYGNCNIEQWQLLTLDVQAGPVCEGEAISMLGYLLTQFVHIFLVDGETEELLSCSYSSSGIVTQDKHVVQSINVVYFQMEFTFPTPCPSPMPQKPLRCAGHGPFKGVFTNSPMLLLSGIVFPLKNLSNEVKYQSRKKLLSLPNSSLTTFSN